MALKEHVIPAKEARLIDKQVDNAKHYNVAVQLGARRTWRRFRGGKWAPDPERNEPGRLAYKHLPRVHRAGRLPGNIVNGLIAEHNKWVRANMDNIQPDGDVGRMLVVIDTEPTTPPAMRSRAFPFDLEALVSKVAESSAAAAVRAISQQRGGGTVSK